MAYLENSITLQSSQYRLTAVLAGELYWFSLTTKPRLFDNLASSLSAIAT
jgi:hypothetical protein